MRRYSQNNDNRYYAFLSSSGSSPSRNSSSHSTNRNAHYQYYDPRLRAQQQTQQTLLEYQISGLSPPRSQHSLFGSTGYQPPSFRQELPLSSANSIADLGEPISLFDDIRPLEHRRSIVTPSLTSSYVPPDPRRRPSASDVRLATAQAVRERLLMDIEQSIDDIDREITSLERRPTGSRYIPPRFSPIAEFETQDNNLFRSTTNVVQSITLPVRRPVSIVTSPAQKSIQQTSAHSTTTSIRERNSGTSQMWPNKPKRVYEVIPNLNDSRKTSRQSSVGGTHDQIKTSEIQTPQSSAKPSEKHLSVSSIQFRGQYHYGPEAEEVEILPNDPENIDPQSSDEIKDGTSYEALHTDQFLRQSSANVKHRASVFTPKISVHSRADLHDSSEDFLHPDQYDTKIPRSTAASVHESTPTRDVNSHSRQAFIPRPPEPQHDRQVAPRLGSRTTIGSNQLYHRTTSDLISQNDPPHVDETQPSRLSGTTPFVPADLPKKPSPSPPRSLSPANPPADTNVNGLVAYFFSDFGNEGEGEEEIVPIDQSNFAVPTGTDIIADDDIRSTIMGPSQASLLILHSAHVPQQQHATKETNNERVKMEENEEIARRAADATKKHISTATSIFSSPSPQPKQVLPTSIIEDMQTHFTRNNNASNNDHYRQSPTIPVNMIEDEERRSNNSRLSRHSASLSKISRVQSRTSRKSDEEMEQNKEETSSMSSSTPAPLENIDNKGNRTPERIDSADQRIKSATKKFSRASSTTSNHTGKNEERTPINSPTKTLFRNIDRENSNSRMSAAREPTSPLNEQVRPDSQASLFHDRHSPLGEQSKPADRASIFHRRQDNSDEEWQPVSRTSLFREQQVDFDGESQPPSRTSTYREPMNVPDERPESTSRTSIHREITNAPDERPESTSRMSIHREITNAPDERPESTSRMSSHREPPNIFDQQSEHGSQTSMYRETLYAPVDRPESAGRNSPYQEPPYAPMERPESSSRNSLYHEPPYAPMERPKSGSRNSAYRELPDAFDDQSQPASRASMSREASPTGFQRPIPRQPSPTPSEEPFPNQQKSPSQRSSSSRNQIGGQSFDVPLGDPLVYSTDDLHKTHTNDNEPQPFMVQSEHFLRNYSQTSPYDLNQRLPSGYSVSHPNDSRRSSTTDSPIPVALDSPDVDDNPHPSSRTATPMRKTSITSIDLPPDPNILLTTTDEADPDDPTVIKSTIHFQMLSSQRPREETPSPLLNIVPVEKIPSRVPSVDLPSELLTTEEQPSPRPLSASLRSPTDPIELEPNKEPSPAATPEIDIHLPSTSPLNPEQKLSQRTPSSVNNEQESARQSPALPYPARLEDLMRPTPSPFHSTVDHKQQEKPNRLPSISPPLSLNENEIHHHPILQASSPKLESNKTPLPPNSPLRRELSNHTSVEGDGDAYRQQLYTPSISPQNETAISPDHIDRISTPQDNHTVEPPQISRHTLAPPRIEPTFITERQRHPSSGKSGSTPQSDRQEDDDQASLYRNDAPLSSASIKPPNKHFPSSSSPPPKRTTVDDREIPTMTPSQLHSKLSLRVLPQQSKRKIIPDQHATPPMTPSSPIPQMNNDDVPATDTEEPLSEEKVKRRRRRVSFSSSIAHFQKEERQSYANWRERVAAILASKRRPNEKYAHIQSRVNSFANFEYQPKKITVVPAKKKPRAKTVESSTPSENKFLKRKKYKVKKPKVREENDTEKTASDEQISLQSPKTLPPQLFGRLWCLPDGTATVFHESLEWNTQSRIRGYSYENFDYEPQPSEFKIFNRKPRWHSESKLADLIKESPRSLPRRTLLPTLSLPIIADRDEPHVHPHPQTPYRQSIYQPQTYETPIYQQPSYQQLGSEKKIFDIQTNTQQQSKARIQRDNMSHDSRLSEVPIFDEKLVWAGKSKLKDTTWQNIHHQPKKSKVQIFNKTVHWNSEPKIRTRSPSTINLSRASNSNVQIFDEKLNWDAQAKIHCWSEIDLRQLTKKKPIFAQHHDPKWNDIVTARVDSTNYQYPRIPNQVEIFSDRLLWTGNSELKDYVWENFDYKTHPRTRQANNQRQSGEIDQTPPNRPKWNTVSKTRSVNSVYNPRMTNANVVRRGWDLDLRRKRVHKLPPLKRKRVHEDLPQLAIDGPSSSGQLAIDYNYDHASTTQGRTTSNGYITTSSRRSSKALVPINPHPLFSELELPMDTPRSQRPVQQEWYDEMNKSRLTHRTDASRATNRPYRHSIDSIHQPNTPKDLATFRSSTRNSQHSVMSGTLLDSSIRTNRTTEFRLLKDMDEHHHHSHTPSQSMPIEIRGFKLEGTQLSVPEHATIRPLSNVSYGTSERVKSRRVYPWSTLHPHGTSSRNSSLVPIAEFRRPSLDTTITESQPLLHEE